MSEVAKVVASRMAAELLTLHPSRLSASGPRLAAAEKTALAIQLVCSDGRGLDED